MCLLSIHHNMGPFYLSNTPKIYSNKMTIIIFSIMKFLPMCYNRDYTGGCGIPKPITIIDESYFLFCTIVSIIIVQSQYIPLCFLLILSIMRIQLGSH